MCCEMWAVPYSYKEQGHPQREMVTGDKSCPLVSRPRPQAPSVLDAADCCTHDFKLAEMDRVNVGSRGKPYKGKIMMIRIYSPVIMSV